MSKPEEAASQPQPRRHSPTARSSQRHVPSATTARASQERGGAEAKGRGRERGGKVRAKVSRQELDKGGGGKNRGQTSQVQKGYEMEAKDEI